MIAHTRTRVLLSLAVLAGAISAASLTTYASFTSSAPATTEVQTGTVTVELGATGSETNRLDLGFADMEPGTSQQRSVDLANTGSIALGSVTLTTNATTSSVLDTDTTNGAQIEIDRCTNTWTESGTAPNLSYTCGGSTLTVLESQPVIGTDMALGNLALPAGGAADHLLVTLSLPSSAGNSFQNAASALTFTFDATQRSGTYR